MLELYKARMKNMGRNMGEALKYQSDMIMEQTFTNDIGYRKIFVQIVEENELKPGEEYFEYNYMKWVQRDAKYSTHASQTISSDFVDYYLQFRTNEHHSVGRYVIVPDDTTFDPDITDKTQWWLIVGRDNSDQFVQYNILQCNWNFQWISEGVVYECYAALRNANSYTSWSIFLLRYYTARCIWKHCSVFLRICWKALRVVIPKQKDEIYLNGMV